jgi:hypothetical protein
VRQRAQHEIQHDAAVVDELLEFCGASGPQPDSRYASPRTYTGYSVPLICESGSGTPSSYLKATRNESIAAAAAFRLNAIDARIAGNQNLWSGVLRGKRRASSPASAVARSVLVV